MNYTIASNLLIAIGIIVNLLFFYIVLTERLFNFFWSSQK